MMTDTSISIQDPLNARILEISEDRIQGFQQDPLGEIAHLADLPRPLIAERIQAMLRAGTIRRVRQTLMATNLAHGALVAWQLPAERLNEAFDFMFHQDPFSGHVVIRSTDAATTGHKYRLWTTLKVPEGFSLQKHCELLCRTTGAERFLMMPAKRLFALGVGHVRRKSLEPGAKADQPAEVQTPEIVSLSDRDWRVLIAIKREFTPDELAPFADPTASPPPFWTARAAEAGVELAAFHETAHSLNQRGVIGRFSTFLEHVKPLATGERVTKFNALFHWAVPPGREIDAGSEIGRFYIMTHAYWREGGLEFGNVNIMGVAHGTDRGLLLAHKKAIDEHLAAAGIPVTYTNVFWGGRSEIKPSEISPFAYEAFCRRHGVNPAAMRASLPS